MRSFCFTELCKKEVISIDCGKKLGYPKDIQIDCRHGQILNLIIPCKSTISLFSGNNCIKVPWCDVEKIGEDIIWVCGDFGRKETDCNDRNNKRDKGCCS